MAETVSRAADERRFVPSLSRSTRVSAWLCNRRKHLATIVDEWHRANAAALRYDELNRLDPTQLRRLGIGREGIARRVFDEFYAQHCATVLGTHQATAVRLRSDRPLADT